MSKIVSNYATLISDKKIIFLPTCIVIEIMATMHGHVMRMPVTGRLTEAHLGIMALLLARFTNDLQSTAGAYEAGKVRMFMGDWKLDRLKADRIFFNMMERLEEICNRYFDRYRPRLRAMIRDLKREWTRLYRLLDMKSGAGDRCDRDSAVRYFHCNDPKSWRKTMASIVLSMAETFCDELSADANAYLLLLCYTRLKASLIAQIEELQQRSGRRVNFDESKILCVSEQDIRISCPICVSFTEDIAKSKKEANAAIGTVKRPQHAR